VQPIKRFSDQVYLDASEASAWLDLAGKTRCLASLFADVFFEAAGGWWFLDTTEGILKRRWSTGELLPP
jgi:hypothetical protein